MNEERGKLYMLLTIALCFQCPNYFTGQKKMHPNNSNLKIEQNTQIKEHLGNTHVKRGEKDEGWRVKKETPSLQKQPSLLKYYGAKKQNRACVWEDLGQDTCRWWLNLTKSNRFCCSFTDWSKTALSILKGGWKLLWYFLLVTSFLSFTFPLFKEEALPPLKVWCCSVLAAKWITFEVGRKTPLSFL